MKCDQDLCLNLCYDLKKLLWQDELNPRVRCAFGNVYFKMLITFEPNVAQRSVASQNDHKRKACLCFKDQLTLTRIAYPKSYVEIKPTIPQP